MVWNVLIMAFMIGTHVTIDDQGDQLYGYAIGVLVGTIAQLVMAIPLVRRQGFRPRASPLEHGRAGQAGARAHGAGRRSASALVNFNLLINSTLGFKISEEVPRAIDAAFRLYMLPRASSAWRSRPCCSRR